MMPVKGQGVMLHKFVASKIVGGRGYKHGGQRDIYPEGGGATFAHKFTWQIPPQKTDKSEGSNANCYHGTFD